MSRIPMAAPALAFVVIAASGCGGSSKSGKTASAGHATRSSAQTGSSSPLGSLTRAELIARADPICRSVNAKRVAIHITRKQAYVSALPRLADAERAATAELSKLAPPASMASDWHEIVADNRVIAASIAKVATYMTAHDASATRAAFVAGSRAVQGMIATAKRDGFKDCATI